MSVKSIDAPEVWDNRPIRAIHIVGTYFMNNLVKSTEGTNRYTNEPPSRGALISPRWVCKSTGYHAFRKTAT